MTSPSLIRAARLAPDRAQRVALMVETMRHHRNGPDGACTFRDLTAEGFTEAEIEAYRDEARGILSNRPRIVLAQPPGRMEGHQLVTAAKAVRRRIAKHATAG